ncbi:MAG: sugar kinase [Salinisphaera sp.]|jgi:sugar/nucleoside kinase (ribokinase family)|nr:sugar kinase [Salinisphaera sp.]
MRYDFTSMGFYTFDCLGRPVSELPPNGDTFFIDEMTLAVSGAAGSASIAASRYGLKTLAVGGVGEDLMGDWVLERLKHFDVDISTMQRCPDAGTSSSIVTTRPNGDRPALHRRGATANFEVTAAMRDQVLDCRVLLIGGVGLIDRMDGAPSVALFKEAKRRGVITLLDVFASKAEDMDLIEGLLPYTDYFLPSIEEAAALSGQNECEEMAAFFLERGVGCVTLTLGADGAYYHHADGTRFHQPPFGVDVVCTCGCGDVFNAGFATGLCHGLDAETTVRFAQATSALNATGLGSQAGVRAYEHTLEIMDRWPIRALQTG